MTYSGNLVRSVASPDDQTPPWPHPAHGQDQSDPYPDRHQVPEGYGQEYAGTAMPTMMVTGGGLVLDQPDWSDHDSPAVLYPLDSDAEQVEVIGAAHDGRDRGYMRSTYREPELQSSGTVYGEENTEGFVSLPPNQTNLARGINSYEQNNPPREGYVQGFRQGVNRWLQAQVDRPWSYGGRRVYDLQPLTERDFYTPTDTPPVENPPSYGPFGGLFGPHIRRDTVPQLARDPGTIDDPLMAEPVVGIDSVIGHEVI